MITRLSERALGEQEETQHPPSASTYTHIPYTDRREGEREGGREERKEGREGRKGGRKNLKNHS